MNDFNKYPLLNSLISELEDVVSQWNGKESGSQEDAAQAASEAIEKVKELRNLLVELNIKY